MDEANSGAGGAREEAGGGAPFQALTCRTACGFVRGQWPLTEVDEAANVREIGDGNLNLVFCVPTHSSSPLILKQALPYVRCVGPEWPLSEARAHFESIALRAEAQVVPQFIPRVLGTCRERAVILMEYLTPHEVVRAALVRGEQLPLLATHLGQYLGRSRYHLSRYGVGGAKRVAALMREIAGNLPMQQLTEGVVFTDPFVAGAAHNHWTDTPEMHAAVRHLQESAVYASKAEELLHLFRSKKEALLHGDLHTGSIMATATDTKVIDPEFCMVGPIGFDVGMLLANFLLCYCSHARTEGASGNAAMCEYLRGCVRDVWCVFSDEFSSAWEKDHAAETEGAEAGAGAGAGAATRAEVEGGITAREVLACVWGESIGFCAIEMVRRVVGVAHVQDLERIEPPHERSARECIALYTAAMLLQSGARDIAAIWQIIDSGGGAHSEFFARPAA
eukprot:TRINITY_DN6412_c0_g1_i1.p1 TRINITY_DN6412_c0_g1~~TRINITY_DN6412_c0_g1_i1.p1  ORF type:complete len:456 (-),score=117.92 TRINITY_DN6412_c0_g1_i1:101-1447(-)